MACAEGKFKELGAAALWNAQCLQCAACATGEIREECVKASGGGTCVVCPVGTYKAHGTVEAWDEPCMDCPQGKFQDQGGTSFCKACAMGTFKAATSIAICRACPGGKYQAGPTQSLCRACDVGRFQAETTGTTACRLCAVGTYNAELAQDSAADCNACPQGHFNPELGQVSLCQSVLLHCQLIDPRPRNFLTAKLAVSRRHCRFFIISNSTSLPASCLSSHTHPPFAPLCHLLFPSSRPPACPLPPAG